MKIASGMNRPLRVRNSRTFVNRNRCCRCGGSSSGGAMSGKRRCSSGISFASSGALAPTAWRNAAAGISRRGLLEHFDVRDERRRALLLVTAADQRLTPEPPRSRQGIFRKSSLADTRVARAAG